MMLSVIVGMIVAALGAIRVSCHPHAWHFSRLLIQESGIIAFQNQNEALLVIMVLLPLVMVVGLLAGIFVLCVEPMCESIR